MAYEDMTYELILHRMISRVSEQYPNLDTREGSIIFNALAPAAIELAIMYTELDNVMQESFVETASREYLYRKCEEVGIDVSQFEASYCTRGALFNVEVEIGSRWNCDLYNYTVMQYVDHFENEGDGIGIGYYYVLQCETAGTAPNNTYGDLTPITNYPDGLTYAELLVQMEDGYDEVSDDEIKKMYYAYVSRNSGDGNVGQYETFCDLYDGIGHYKIFPLWNGANTVKVSILSESNGVASDYFVAAFQEYLDPGSKGMGDGVAPLGAIVTVTTATAVPLNISASVTLKEGYTDTNQIDEELKQYLSGIAYQKNQIPYLNVGATIINTECVESITNLKINGGTDNINLGDEEIPVLGTVNWTVV